MSKTYGEHGFSESSLACDCRLTLNRLRFKEINAYLRHPRSAALPREMRIKDIVAHLFDYHVIAPGVSAPLSNHSAIGRNSPNVSVNGSRVTQNSYQINGVDGDDISLHNFGDVAVPAPEGTSEVNVQTSLYDASVTGAGGSVQVVTKSGSNFLHGSGYEYFRNEAFNANDANLKTVGASPGDEAQPLRCNAGRAASQHRDVFITLLAAPDPQISV